MAQPTQRSFISRGFTLIELMIVVAIIGILAAVALPAYNDYVRRGQLPEAFASMSDYRIKMEQYFQDNKNYGTAACGDGTTATWKNFTATTYFTYSCALAGTPSGSGYTLTATGATGQAVGHVYTINAANQRRTTTFKGAAVTKNCWASKGSEC